MCSEGKVFVIRPFESIKFLTINRSRVTDSSINSAGEKNIEDLIKKKSLVIKILGLLNFRTVKELS